MCGSFSRLNRKRDETGFILPLTLVIVFLLSAFLLHEIKMYESEKWFLEASEEMDTLGQLMEMADVDLEKRLSGSISGKNNGMLAYQKGTVRYAVVAYHANVLRITLRAETNEGGVHVSHIYYDKIKQKIIRWEEQV